MQNTTSTHRPSTAARGTARQNRPHKSGGQGRVTNPSTDKRLKRNRSTSQ